MKRVIFGILLIAVVGLAKLEAHAFLQRAEPAVGSAVQKAPGEVRIWFSEKLEPALSTIQVFDVSGKQVDKGDGYLDRSNRELLRVSLAPLHAGTYKVVWCVVSIDSHATKGSFTFRVIR
jgi:methionine-rich copper-binding protein CopC